MIPTLLKENQNHIVRPKKLMSSNPSHLSFEEILKLASERIKHHVPRQVGDLTGPQASLGGKQNDHTVAKGMPGAGSKNQEVVDITSGEYFCLLTWHSESLSRTSSYV